LSSICDLLNLLWMIWVVFVGFAILGVTERIWFSFLYSFRMGCFGTILRKNSSGTPHSRTVWKRKSQFWNTPFLNYIKTKTTVLKHPIPELWFSFLYNFGMGCSGTVLRQNTPFWNCTKTKTIVPEWGIPKLSSKFRIHVATTALHMCAVGLPPFYRHQWHTPLLKSPHTLHLMLSMFHNFFGVNIQCT